MKLKAHIYKVEDNGESILLTAQGTAKKAPNWMTNMSSVELTVPNTKTNVKAFHLGREIEITIKPKGR